MLIEDLMATPLGSSNPDSDMYFSEETISKVKVEAITNKNVVIRKIHTTTTTTTQIPEDLDIDISNEDNITTSKEVVKSVKNKIIKEPTWRMSIDLILNKKLRKVLCKNNALFYLFKLITISQDMQVIFRHFSDIERGSCLITAIKALKKIHFIREIIRLNRHKITIGSKRYTYYKYIKSGGYIDIPYSLANDEFLKKRNLFYILLYLIVTSKRKGWADGKVFKPMENIYDKGFIGQYTTATHISTEIGMNVKTVVIYIKELSDNGYIKVSQSNSYKKSKKIIVATHKDGVESYFFNDKIKGEEL
jgi:hypothetical protein